MYTFDAECAHRRYSSPVALYEYQCAKGHSVEVFHRMDDTPKVVCDQCGGKAERVLGWRHED